MTFLQVYAWVGLAILAMMTILWIASLILKNASIVDIFWGAGFVLSNWIAFAVTPGDLSGRRLLISLLVTIWGLRLSGYIFQRNKGKPEDFRYQKFRADAGAKWWWYSFFQTFLLQGVLMWIISIPLVAAQFAGPASLTALDIIGALVWAIGFFFESAGDAQLARFRANPANKGKLLNTGVWRYTRHPNYFGDAAQWWGFYLIAASAGAFWSIYSPILMTLLLLRVSGVALLEKTLANTKPGYQEYIETTSAFVPWFPRKKENK